MKGISPMGRPMDSGAQIMPCMSLADTQAISEKTGEAAKTSQIPASGDCRVLSLRFLASVTIDIFELFSVERHRQISVLNLRKIYGRPAGGRE